MPTNEDSRFEASIIDTSLGRCGLVWADTAIVGFHLPDTSGDRIRELLTDSRALLLPEPTTGRRAETVRGIRAHLDGELDNLRWIDIELVGVPEFHRKVYAVTRAIPPGHTLSYGEVAARAAAPAAARAVGRALGDNPIPLVIPCHRVLAADHGLHGFSAPGGIDTKQRLLGIERTPGFGEPALF